LVACEEYHLPQHISDHVDFVLPSVHFDAKIKRRSGNEPEPARAVGQPGVGITPKTAGTISQQVESELDQCDEYITPICLRTLYNLTYTPVATDKNSYGIGMIPLSATAWSNSSCSGVHSSGVLGNRSANVRHELFY